MLYINKCDDADVELLRSPMLIEPQLATCLGQVLVNLDITAFRGQGLQATFDMDCISVLSNLQHLCVTDNSSDWGLGCFWRTKRALSCLCSLRTCWFDQCLLEGPIFSALSGLPHLKTLELSACYLPEQHLQLDHQHFTALEVFSLQYNGDQASPKFDLLLEVANTVCPLRELLLEQCSLGQSSVCFSCMTNLTALRFDDCVFNGAPGVWLSEVLNNATQLQELTIDASCSAFPEGVCQLRSLQCLRLPYNGLSTLPSTLVNLSSLSELDLSQNSFNSIPQVLEQMTHLCRLDMYCSGDDVHQLTRPLTFLSAFTKLELFNWNEPAESWNSLSMMYIGQLRAAMYRAFKHRSSSDRPVIDLFRRKGQCDLLFNGITPFYDASSSDFERSESDPE